MPTSASQIPDKPRGGQLGRREFLVTAGTGLTLAFVLPTATRLGVAEAAGDTQVNAWLQIGADESITLTIGASEMGQGSFSGLAQIMAEDLIVDYARVRAVQAPPPSSIRSRWAPPSTRWAAA